MLNQVILVGKVFSEVTKVEDSKYNRSSLTLKVEKPEGRFTVINVQMADSVAEYAKEYLKLGTTVGVKARLENELEDETLSDGTKLPKLNMIVVAEKMTFISHKMNKA